MLSEIGLRCPTCKSLNIVPIDDNTSKCTSCNTSFDDTDGRENDGKILKSNSSGSANYNTVY